jgi:hypothetical protein
MDCSSKRRSSKCKGGYIPDALKFAKTSFVALRDNYPYLMFSS